MQLCVDSNEYGVATSKGKTYKVLEAASALVEVPEWFDVGF
jgi:hypothetical protein